MVVYLNFIIGKSGDFITFIKTMNRSKIFQQAAESMV